MSSRSCPLSRAHALVLAMPFAACAMEPGEPGFPVSPDTATTARLSTQGSLIVSAGTGLEVPLRGANTIRTWDIDVQLMQQAGMNFVRVPVDWARFEPDAPTGTPGHLEHHWNNGPDGVSGPVHELDQIVARLEAAHIRVMLDVHQSKWSPAFRYDQPVRPGMPSWLYPSAGNFTSAGAAHDAELAAKYDFFFNRPDPRLAVPLAPGEGPQDLYAQFAAMLVSRYADHEYVVGLDMMNEPNWGPVDAPGAPGAAELVAFYDKVWTYANPSAPKHYLWAYENVWLEAEPAQHPVIDETTYFSRPHAVFSMHFYPKQPGAATNQLLAKLDREIEIAHNVGQPFWLGEWDAFTGMRQNVSIPNWKQRTCSLLAHLDAEHIPETVWAFERGASAWVEVSNGQDDHNPTLNTDLVQLLDGSACQLPPRAPGS